MQSDILWKSGIITLVVFVLGFGAALYLDNQQVERLKSEITEVDLNMNDARITGLYYQIFSGDTGFCSSAFEANQEFCLRLYRQGLSIQAVEDSNKLASGVIQEKKRYALLQMQYWLNALQLREKCGFNYSTIVYFYSYTDEG